VSEDWLFYSDSMSADPILIQFSKCSISKLSEFLTNSDRDIAKKPVT